MEQTEENDPWGEEEAALAAFLSSQYSGTYKKHIPRLREAYISASQSGDFQIVQDELVAIQSEEDAGAVRSGDFDTLKAITAALVFRGIADGVPAQRSAFDQSSVDQQTLTSAAVGVQTRANTKFERSISSTATRALDILENNVDTEDLGLSEFEEVLDSRFGDGTKELDLEAQQTSVRAYGWGVLNSGLRAGIRTYVYDAVIDGSTTKVCTHLNGRIFNVIDGHERFVSIFLSDPNDIASVSPWLVEDDVSGLETFQLSSQGILTPPLHPFCRSVIRLLG